MISKDVLFKDMYLLSPCNSYSGVEVGLKLHTQKVTVELIPLKAFWSTLYSNLM